MARYIVGYIAYAPNDGYVAIDRRGGGYPYTVRMSREAEIFGTPEKLKSYMKKFSPRFSGGFEIATVSMDLEVSEETQKKPTKRRR